MARELEHAEGRASTNRGGDANEKREQQLAGVSAS
jgi:hypothetical protein